MTMKDSIYFILEKNKYQFSLTHENNCLFL